MTGISEWQARVGRAWADEWQRTDRSFAGLTPHLLQVIAARSRPFSVALPGIFFL